MSVFRQYRFLIIFLAVLFGAMGIFITHLLIKNHKRNSLPNQTLWAQVVSKDIHISLGAAGHRSTKYRVVTFETADAKIFTLRIPPKQQEEFYENINIGETGTLTFKGPIESEYFADRVFVNFEREP